MSAHRQSVSSMTATTFEDILNWSIGDASIGENLEHARTSGAILEHADGTFELAREPNEGSLCLRVHGEGDLDCVFKNAFLFQHVYRQAVVPRGCAACYKVKVVPRTLRELVALYNVAKATACFSKCGIDFYNRHSQNLYAGYFYVSGLDEARDLFARLRAILDQDPLLGRDVPILIKRGCSNYEAALGPSDKYTFKPELSDIEALLSPRFRRRTHHRNNADPALIAAVLFKSWVPFAHQIGDDTYMDFTHGKRLFPPSITYEPDPLD